VAHAARFRSLLPVGFYNEKNRSILIGDLRRRIELVDFKET